MAKPNEILKAYIDPNTGLVYADEGKSSSITPIGFVISSGVNVGGALLHGSLAGLDADDHNQYILVDGSRAFSGLPFTTATGVAPTDPGDLVTKAFLDTVVVSGVAGVASINSATGSLTLVGAGQADVTTIGNTITVTVSGVSSGGFDKAIIGLGSVTVTSGTDTVTVSGVEPFITKDEFVVSVLPVSPDEGTMVYHLPTKQVLVYDGTDWNILG